MISRQGKVNSLKLKRLLGKKEVRQTIIKTIETVATPVSIRDAESNLILGEDLKYSLYKYPVIIEEQLLGWVIGKQDISFLANLLTCFARQELEKKALAGETLDRYKELNLIYKLSEKLSASLELEEIAKLILNEAMTIIKATSGSVMLLNPKKQELEIVATAGDESFLKTNIQLGEGIAGYVAKTGKAEIVNDVVADSRYLPYHHETASLICAPLKAKDLPIGAINLCSTQNVQYTAADLKLLAAISSQAATAIENALLHKNKLKEERIKNNLERYVTSQVVQTILSDKEGISLEPNKKDVSILFSDIRNFTGKCEELAPERIVAYLNEYFTHMVDVIFDHQGTVNKLVGDMIVAFFGAPSSTLNTEQKAIATAIDMQKRIQTIPEVWIRKNFPTGIGISSGKVVVGNIGSPKHMDYTAIGDEVNIASRLQSLAKGGQILVSRSIYDVTKDTFDFENFGIVKVKGKKNAIEVFEVKY
ncbi:MAG: adenylate/guanylate cyclase domain-containing protein [Spirulinaceae cyanobacterium]